MLSWIGPQVKHKVPLGMQYSLGSLWPRPGMNSSPTITGDPFVVQGWRKKPMRKDPGYGFYRSTRKNPKALSARSSEVFRSLTPIVLSAAASSGQYPLSLCFLKISYPISFLSALEEAAQDPDSPLAKGYCLPLLGKLEYVGTMTARVSESLYCLAQLWNL